MYARISFERRPGPGSLTRSADFRQFRNVALQHCSVADRRPYRGGRALMALQASADVRPRARRLRFRRRRGLAPRPAGARRLLGASGFPPLGLDLGLGRGRGKSVTDTRRRLPYPTLCASLPRPAPAATTRSPRRRLAGRCGLRLRHYWGHICWHLCWHLRRCERRLLDTRELHRRDPRHVSQSHIERPNFRLLLTTLGQ